MKRKLRTVATPAAISAVQLSAVWCRSSTFLRATTDVVYVRLHGPDSHHLYAGSYPDQDLRWWADRIQEWDAAGQDVFGYFNNDGDANAVRNARTLRALVNQ